MARFYKLLVMVCFLIIADQLTKGWVQSSFQLWESQPVIDGFFNFTYVQNKGAAFGMGSDAGSIPRAIMFLFLPTVFTFWVIYMLIKTIKGAWHMSLAYALIVAGAVGNLIDRFWLGYVVDFLDFYYKSSHFPAFNIADSCITVAAFILIIDMIINGKKNQEISPKTEQTES
jgi:signal peptidase II